MSCCDNAWTYRVLLGSHNILDARPDIDAPTPVEIVEVVEDAGVEVSDGVLVLPSSVRCRTERALSTA